MYNTRRMYNTIGGILRTATIVVRNTSVTFYVTIVTRSSERDIINR